MITQNQGQVVHFSKHDRAMIDLGDRAAFIHYETGYVVDREDQELLGRLLNREAHRKNAPHEEPALTKQEKNDLKALKARKIWGVASVSRVTFLYSPSAIDSYTDQHTLGKEQLRLINEKIMEIEEPSGDYTPPFKLLPEFEDF